MHALSNIAYGHHSPLNLESTRDSQLGILAKSSEHISWCSLHMWQILRVKFVCGKLRNHLCCAEHNKSRSAAAGYIPSLFLRIGTPNTTLSPPSLPFLGRFENFSLFLGSYGHCGPLFRPLALFLTPWEFSGQYFMVCVASPLAPQSGQV